MPTRKTSLKANRVLELLLNRALVYFDCSENTISPISASDLEIKDQIGNEAKVCNSLWLPSKETIKLKSNLNRPELKYCGKGSDCKYTPKSLLFIIYSLFTFWVESGLRPPLCTGMETIQQYCICESFLAIS